MKTMDFGKMFKKLETSHILAGVAFLVLLWALMNYSKSKSTMGFNSDTSNALLTAVGVNDQMPDTAASVPSSSNNELNGSRNSVSANELLPSGATEGAPNGQLGGMNFLKAGHHVGINTVSSSLRNANYQLRADPPIAKKNVGPWQSSTIDQDLERKPLEFCGN
jgi:hypothetical protein